MSSSESDDLEGFESAEEDLPLPCVDDVPTVDVAVPKTSRRKGHEESLASVSIVESITNNKQTPTKSPVENDEGSLFPSETGPSQRDHMCIMGIFPSENIQEFSHNVDADIIPNTDDSNRLEATSVRSSNNTDLDRLSGSTKDSNKAISDISDASPDAKLVPLDIPKEITDRLQHIQLPKDMFGCDVMGADDLLDSVTLQDYQQMFPQLLSSSVQKADEPPKTDTKKVDQWNFEEGDIELCDTQEDNSQSLLSSSSPQKSGKAVGVKADNLADGWDFEEDIELPEENSPSILSSASSIRNVINPIERITGIVPPETDNSGIDNASSGWDFEDDFDLKDLDHDEKEYKNIEHISCDSILSNAVVNDNAVWPSWGVWGVSSLIGTAGVSTLTQVTSGLSSMLENTLGAPDPQLLATQLKSKIDLEQKPTEAGSKLPHHSDLTADIFGFGNIIGGVKNLGNKVIDGGLETLETLGKKTMEVLQEGDPGLKKKRAMLFQSDKVILSQVLRDAKEKAEASENEPQKLSRKAQYETLFDDFHGLVHLEALEMISRQCEIKMQTVLSNSPKCSLDEFNEAINLVKHLYEEEEIKVSTNEYDHTEEDTKPSDDDLQDVLLTCMHTLSLNVDIKHFLEVDSAIENGLKLTYEDVSLIHTTAISDLAQFTACSIELFHRIAELFIVKDIKDVENDFKALSRVARASKYKIGKISENYCAKLILMPDKAASPLITNIFLEASNSSTYLDNAFELFAPILQSKALQNEISRN